MACSKSAPGLVQAYNKYRNRGVAFVSLTADLADHARSFVDQFAIPWPCGYGVALKEIARWGVYSQAGMFSNYQPDFAVKPTLFLLSSERRVLWCDGQMRPRHIKDTQELLRQLDNAINAALKSTKHAS
jgi:hypothetical protein